MKKNILHVVSIFIFALLSCTGVESDILGTSKDGLSSFGAERGKSGSATPEGTGNGDTQPNPQAGTITAAEWNDLNKWDFWNKLIKKDEFKSMSEYWHFHHNNRVSVLITDNSSKPIIDAIVKLKNGESTVFIAKTDNSGRAELWIDLFQISEQIDINRYSLDINNGAKTVNDVKLYKDGINEIEIPYTNFSDVIEIAFVVDATGSMGDELEYLKKELLDVIYRVKTDNPSSKIATSSVFYRDKGDEYVTRISDFGTGVNATLEFIKSQRASGGGDYPEAVHSALDKAVNELAWSTKAKTRIMFLLLDAPPHYENDVISALQKHIKSAAEKGIKIIPITASGIDKKTEFLMRYMAISTNGTYVFITNHSGVGNDHIEPSVGEYQVEKLNALMIRLINKYSKVSK